MPMVCAARMEWTKLRTMPATGWSMFGLLVSTLALSALASAQTGPSDCAPRPCTLDTTKIALTGIYVGQISVVVLAVLAVTAEYDTMTIRTTLAAVPGRLRVFAAKAAVTAATVLVMATLTVAGCLELSRIIMVRNGFQAVSLWGALPGGVIYLGLLALLSLGVAATVRQTATAITIMLALLYVPPIVARFTEPGWQQQIAKYSAMTAGNGKLAMYAAGAMLLGALIFHYRDG